MDPAPVKLPRIAVEKRLFAFTKPNRAPAPGLVLGLALKKTPEVVKPRQKRSISLAMLPGNKKLIRT